MADYIDTREGWREVKPSTPRMSEDFVSAQLDGRMHYWVRETPEVPPRRNPDE